MTAIAAAGVLPRERASVAALGENLSVAYAFQGRVYDGYPYDENRHLRDVTVSLYGSNNPYQVGDLGTWLASDTTDGDGFWSISLDEGVVWEFFFLVETDPQGYHSVDATSVDGTKRNNNCVEFAWELAGQNLTGIKFWDIPEDATLTPSVTATPRYTSEPSATPTATLTPQSLPEDTPTATLTPQAPPEETPTTTLTPKSPPDETPTASATPEETPALGQPPVRFPEEDWPWYAQGEISVDPEPPVAGGLTRLCCYVINHDPENDRTVDLEFRVANFGIGIPFSTVDSVLVNVPAGGRGDGCVIWTPPTPGHWCVEVLIHQEGFDPLRSQRNMDLDEPLESGVPHQKVFPVGNPFPWPVTIELGLVPHAEGWGIELSQDVLADMAPGEIRDIVLTVTPPDAGPLPQQEILVVDVEAWVDGEVIGGFRKVYRPPIPLHRQDEPPYAESEITIDPYPVHAGVPSEICVELRNPTDRPYDVTLELGWTPLGIAAPAVPINGPIPVSLPPYSTINQCIHWIPPLEGSVCIEAILHVPGYEPQVSRRNVDADEPLQPLTPHARTVQVCNPFDRPVTITLGLVPHWAGWGLELSEDVLPNVEPFGCRNVTLIVTPPNSLPADGDPIVDVEAYVDGELIGGFRKVYRPPVQLHKPKDPVYAETEIGIDPYPLLLGQQANLSVEVYNPTDQDQIVDVTFAVAPFGIGLPFSEASIVPNPVAIYVPAHGAARGHAVWAPPDFAGQFCVQATLDIEGHEPVWSRRNMDIGEPLQPGVPHALTFDLGAGQFQNPVTVTMGAITHKPGWEAAVEPKVLPNVVPGQFVQATLIVTPSQDANLATGDPIVDVEAYVDGELVGGFRKLDIPPVQLHKPHEKRYAESEITVAPDPPQIGKVSVISTTLQNTGAAPVTVDVECGWADFGMGIPFTTTGVIPAVQTVNLAPGTQTIATANWTPSQSGHQCVQVRLLDPDGILEPQISQRNVDVAERPVCGTTKIFTFTVYNDSAFAVTVDIGMITFNVPSHWQVTTDPTGQMQLAPFSDGVVTVHVFIPCQPAQQSVLQDVNLNRLQAASGSVPIIDVEGYIAGRAVGGIEIRFEEVDAGPVPRLQLPLITKSQVMYRASGAR